MKEGVIKFKYNWEEAAALDSDTVADLVQVRQRLFKAGFIGEDEYGAGYGNLSKRIGKGSKFIISGSQTGNIKTVTNEHFTIVKSFNIIKNHIHCSGPVKASSESLTHAALYGFSEKINAVIHIHNYNFWNKMLNKLPSTAKDIGYGTLAMALEMNRLANEADLLKLRILIMGGRDGGIITFGNSIFEAEKILLSYIK